MNTPWAATVLSHDDVADILAIERIAAVPTILEVVCRTTGMGFAAVARVTEDRWIACGVRDAIGFGLQPGGELKVETTICDEIRQTGTAVVIDDVARDETFCNHPTSAMYGFQSYISVPIVLPDGRFFGTLCAIDLKPATVSKPEVVGMFKMFADLIGFHLDAHARLASNETVQRSEAFVKGVLAASPDCVTVLSAGGRLEFMNERGIELNQLGSADTVLGREFAALWPEDERPKIRDAIGRAATGEIARAEGYCPTAKGEPRWWESSFAAFRPSRTDPLKLVGVSRDVTERVRAEQALHGLNDELERRVAARTQERDRIWHVSRDMLGVADSAGVWLSINPAWTRVLGWSVEDLVGRTAAWICHPDDMSRARNERDSLAAGQTLVNVENRLRTKDGDYRLLAWTAVPYEGLTYAVARDVTEERQREAALRDAEDFTRLALTSVGGVGVWTYDVQSDRFACDASISDLYGLDAARAAKGIPRVEFTANVHPEDRQALKATMDGGLVDAGDLELEYRILHPDGRIRWVLSRGHTYHDEEGRPVRRTGVGVETTSQRQLEEQLRQSQKLEAVGQLTGGVAHDFNNLLTVIKSSTDLLRRPGLGDERRERYIEAIASTVDRAARLTGQLLSFARRQTLQPSIFDAAQSVMTIADMVGTLAGARIRILTQLPEEPCYIRADPSQFETALVNMAVNARDAMDGEGQLTITVSAVPIMPAGRGHAAVEAPFIAVALTDTGCGIPPDRLERIFEPFFTTKDVGHGTGLGLSQVFGFAQQSGGEVRVDSAPGQGSTFTLYLPRELTEPAPQGADVQEAATDGRGTCVLVVEDNRDVGLFVTQTLTELGYRTTLVENAADALAVLADNPRAHEIVFSDVVMPGMNGVELAREVNRLYPGLPVVLTSGYSEILAKENGHPFELLHKPYSVEQLSRVLLKAAVMRPHDSEKTE